MSRIANTFKNGNKAFIGFVVTGDPGITQTAEFILEMESAGADIIEIGIPFSDPVAEGPVIEAANIRALSKGTTVHDVFDLVVSVRRKSEIPLVLLTYLNPVFHYGYEKFFSKCKETGVDGIIVPDLPFEECREVADITEKYGIDLISLITPTSKERIKMISEGAKGFLYFVSSMGTTGVREEVETNVKPVIDSVRASSDIPVAVGFGISRNEQAKALSQYADGVIVGSAIVDIIANHGEKAGKHLYEYVKNIKNAMN
ncbi:MAG: tryptophan synthase subunit alpha [Oscillospiraceae bacterium]|nr:tryptophan synthase subunit alpha [Oscillospiraceae bacterium]